ncbi:hypothetical protein OG884_29980 [Streptosporangium sp. NBC_01755]|uniref:putative Ig domain-containing protein n=1 Tax=unclassified Streptosporangium TaxID=2632669 RepID=UPI002DDA83BE|nr:MULTISPECIES: putative Ig domain-containing protein [unclassified Streptosporangium]WSA22811.1 hypothetical protein OIE13_17605 [Streptosporangium sp. NBC_01810]WSC99045.1 hypothetical protein OG884_29980 [Streptosporangium sp. NBC_01755]
MRGTRGFSLVGSLVAGAVTFGPPATPQVTLATPASVQAAASKGPAPVRTPADDGVERPAVKPERPIVDDADPPPPSAHPSLGHFGAPADRPLRGRITLANPTGETLGFRVADPTLLPAGITLDADGLLGGASRVPGTWTVPIEACAPSGACTTGTVTITITCRCAGPLPTATAPASSPSGPARSPG